MTKYIIFITVFILVFLWVLVSGLLRHNKIRKNNRKIQEGWRDLAINGNKITVYFEDCEIKTNEYFEPSTSDLPSNNKGILDALTNSSRPTGNVQRAISVIIFKHKDSFGLCREFMSDRIMMPLESLRHALEIKKYTTIYIDKVDAGRYYFDISFIKNTDIDY